MASSPRIFVLGLGDAVIGEWPGGHFMVETKGIIKPIIRNAYGAKGGELKRFRSSSSS